MLMLTCYFVVVQFSWILCHIIETKITTPTITATSSVSATMVAAWTSVMAMSAATKAAEDNHNHNSISEIIMYTSYP